jgi:hypothetical protein
MGFPGISRGASITGETGLAGMSDFADTARPWKLIYDLSSTNEMLFNLEDDPDESHDSSPDAPGRLPR